MPDDSNPDNTAAGWMPGDLTAKQLAERIIRVDHAGEYGAEQIYRGQLAVLGRRSSAAVVRNMADQERRHLEEFSRVLVERQVRPTLLQPLWQVAGFALGAVSALAGEKTAMACTVAVEEVIVDHYASQAERLGDNDDELREMLEEYGAEEAEHRDQALASGAEQAPGYDLFSGMVRRGTRLAIWLSERI